MTVCNKCRTDNPPDSRFCCMCGGALGDGPARPNVKPEDIDRLLMDGYRTVHEGDPAEALHLANAILDVDPDNASAMALKAICHEKRGETDAAIDVYEQLVLLNPGSTLDRIKLAQLRRRAAAAPPDELEHRSRNWVAGLSGIAATLLVVTAGGAPPR
ncbi:MAG: tetratricopeptide repeat protein, partial [Armatimonadetes bacterium]|nr:tetratricopeptide repeat protein [Armatimonadota bacterium]